MKVTVAAIRYYFSTMCKERVGKFHKDYSSNCLPNRTAPTEVSDALTRQGGSPVVGAMRIQILKVWYTNHLSALKSPVEPSAEYIGQHEFPIRNKVIEATGAAALFPITIPYRSTRSSE